MKVEFMEPFVEAACSVLERTAGGHADRGPLGLLGTTFPAACVNIAARISGDLWGEVVYSMSSQTARKLAESLLGAEVRGFGRTAGEGLAMLGEMLVEETQGVLSRNGVSCEIAHPTVFQGLNVEFSTADPALTVSVETELGHVDISLAVRDGRQGQSQNYRDSAAA